MCRIDKKCKNQAILQDPSGCKKILATVGKRFNLKLRDLIDIKKEKKSYVQAEHLQLSTVKKTEALFSFNVEPLFLVEKFSSLCIGKVGTRFFAASAHRNLEDAC
jgi:hypothetical protein